MKKIKYVRQLHNAEKAGKHIDFRMDIDGAAKSWAIRHWPKSIYEKRLAIKQPDHPVGYMGFQGIIPHGQYGAGTVRIEDEGKLDMITMTPDKYIFKMNGEKYSLFNTSGDKWLIEKLT